MAASRPRRARLPVAPALPGLVFALLVVTAAALHWRLSRGLTLYQDEFAWAFQFRHLWSGVLTLWGGWFDPLARLAYNAVFATAGMADYRPLRVLAVVANLALACAVFAYARWIGRRWLGVGAAALLLFLGSSFAVVLLPLNSMNALGLAALPACLVLLAKGRRPADLLALVVLLVAMGFAGPVVLPVCLGVGVWLLLGARTARTAQPAGASRRDLWRLSIPAIPVGVYLLATAVLPGPREPLSLAGNVLRGPAFVADLAGTAAAGLLGLRGDTGPAVLAALAVAAVLGIPKLPDPARRRVLACLATLVGMWAILAVARAHRGDAGSPRYVAFTVVPVVLVGLDLVANGLTATRAVAVAGVLAFAVVANLNTLQWAASFFEAQGEVTRAELGALELGLDRAAPGYRPDARASQPLLYVTAGQWRTATARLGSPGMVPADLPRASPEARLQADRILRELGSVEVRPPAGASPASAACTSRGTPAEEAVAGEGLRVRATGAQPVEVRLRRFADDFPKEAFTVVPPGEGRMLQPARDRSQVSWMAQLKGGTAVACRR